MSDDKQPSSRRSLIKSLVFLPLGAAAGAGAVRALDATAAAAGPAPEKTPEAYTPTFFSAAEWRFVHAACDRLIPHDEHGPGAVELNVPRFLDKHMQTPYAAGDIWYTQGPFLKAAPEFGYQGKLALRDILRVGIKAIDAHVAREFAGKAFADLEAKQQEALLQAAEKGDLKLDDISAKLFFSSLLAEVRNGYFSDPRHGGNQDMGAWKMIGYPGMRADYLDWVEVRDKPYPIGPVDLAGRRG